MQDMFSSCSMVFFRMLLFYLRSYALICLILHVIWRLLFFLDCLFFTRLSTSFSLPFFLLSFIDASSFWLFLCASIYSEFIRISRFDVCMHLITVIIFDTFLIPDLLSPSLNYLFLSPSLSFFLSLLFTLLSCCQFGGTTVKYAVIMLHIGSLMFQWL